MTISHNIPSTTRKPGIYHEFDLLSAAQGLTPLAARVLLIGCKTSGGSATNNVAVQVFDEAQADSLFGTGSEAALMARKALETGRRKGLQPEIWVSPIADPGGTAVIKKITVTAGTAAAAGDIVFRVAGRTLRAGVSAGDDQDDVATAIVNAALAIVAELPVLPAVNGSNANVADFTGRNTGVNGNDIDVEVVSVGLTGLTVTASSPTAGVGAATIATALANSLSQYFEIKAIANHASADITALATHMASAWAAASKRWCFACVGESGTLSAANTLSAAANDHRFIIGSYEDTPSLPGEIAAAIATAIACRALPNYNYDSDELPLYAPPDASVYTDAEIESALSAGSTPLVPNDARDASQIVRLITTKTTHGGNPFENAKDVATIRGMLYVTRDLEAVFSQQFRGVNKTPAIRKRMRSVGYRQLKAWEELEVLQNVDEHFAEFLVEEDENVATRAVVSVPESIVPNLHQIVLKHVLYVE